MGKTLGIDRDTARRIKRMSTKELDGYLTRVTDKSYNNGYEEGLVNGIALAGQALDAVLKQRVESGVFTQAAADEITKEVGKYIAEAPGKAKEQIKAEAAAQEEENKGAWDKCESCIYYGTAADAPETVEPECMWQPNEENGYELPCIKADEAAAVQEGQVADNE
ncbi:MAG: hypothetical protein J6C64_13005 [Lachnospiraceae bacterium]|nr:hypothetical protein [Lachnospiraceae bacterium]